MGKRLFSTPFRHAIGTTQPPINGYRLFCLRESGQQRVELYIQSPYVMAWDLIRHRKNLPLFFRARPSSIAFKTIAIIVNQFEFVPGNIYCLLALFHFSISYWSVQIIGAVDKVDNIRRPRSILANMIEIDLSFIDSYRYKLRDRQARCSADMSVAVSRSGWKLKVACMWMLRVGWTVTVIVIDSNSNQRKWQKTWCLKRQQ
jgi:hypothetical protein